MNEGAQPPPHSDTPPAAPDRARTRKWKAIGCGATVLCFLSVLGLAVFLAGNFAARAIRGENSLKRANALVGSRRYAEALPLYSAALREYLPRNDRALAYGNRGWAYANLERDLEAINDFNSALAINPNLSFALLDRGLAYHRLGKFDQAQADYDRVLALDPNSLDAFRNRAMILAHLGRLPEAIADMDEAIRCDPSNPAWFSVRGYYWLRAGNLETARANYESALRLDPQNEEAYREHATVLARQHESERGIAEVSEAIRQHPDSARLYCARGLVHMDRFDPEKAIEDFDAAILLRSNFALAYAGRAAAEIELKRFETGLSDVRRAIDLAPKFSIPHYVCGHAYYEQHKYREAIEEFDRAIARDSESIWAIDQRALTEAAAGDYESARRDLAEATRRFPGTFEAHMYQAWFLATCPQSEYRDGGKALSEAQLAVKLSDDDPYALDTLAAAYAEGGDFARAQEAARRALAQFPAQAPDRKLIEARLTGFGQRQPYRDHR